MKSLPTVLKDLMLHFLNLMTKITKFQWKFSRLSKKSQVVQKINWTKITLKLCFLLQNASFFFSLTIFFSPLGE